jgi:hypothetical protein
LLKFVAKKVLFVVLGVSKIVIFGMGGEKNVAFFATFESGRG